jgi:predicted GNAT family acetyltransferase
MLEERAMARVEKNAAAERYELRVDGETALVEYRDEDDGTVRLLHTEVPNALAGRGIGSKLAKGVLDVIRAEGRRVVPDCEFIAAYIDRHAEYQYLASADRTEPS